MSNFSNVYFKVPDLKQSYKSGSLDYSNKVVKEANKKLLQSINAQYGSTIGFWSSTFQIPSQVILGFIATESGGRMLKPNQYLATGLMQVTPNAIYECVTKWNREVSVDLPSGATRELNAKVPELLKKAPNNASLRAKLLSLLQRDANFNIMSGTLIIRWLLERFSNTIVGGQLNKTMVAYNAGAYTKALVSGGSAITSYIDTTSLATNPRVPKESRGYLYKMLGQDGFLSLLYQQGALNKI